MSATLPRSAVERIATASNRQSGAISKRRRRPDLTVWHRIAGNAWQLGEWAALLALFVGWLVLMLPVMGVKL